jgi:hypothetical protein
MNQCQSLSKLDNTFQYKLKKLRRLAAGNNYLDLNSKNSTAYITIEAYNSWTLFCRAFCLSCILGTKTKSGIRITNTFPSARNLDNAILLASQILKPTFRFRMPVPRRDEPAWQTSNAIVTLSTQWNFSNISNILSGLSLAPDTLKHLRDFRHFIAHRNNDTLLTSLQWSRNYGIIGVKHPVNMLNLAASGRPQILILDWLDDISNTADEMCR